MAETRQSQFALDVSKWVEQAKGNTDQIVRGVAVELLSRVVMRTPVGNPELWAANAEVMNQRASFNENAARTNSLIDAHPEWRLTRGKLKKQRTLSARTIAKRLPLKAGAGYVGGRARGSWTVTVDAPSTKEPGTIDPSGGSTLGRGYAVIATLKAGPAIYIITNVPYAMRLEFEAWSKQAPAGMVRITVAEFNGIVADEVRRLPT